MSDLTKQKCVPCEGGVDPLTQVEAEQLMKDVPQWQLAEDTKRISRVFTFKNWKQAMQFTNAIGEIAEHEGHHPDIELRWGHVGVSLSTHAIKGLSVNDFIVAAKIDRVLR